MMKQDFLVIDISHICPTCPEPTAPTEGKGQKLTEAARPEQNDRSSQKQHALNQRSSAEGKVFYKQHALNRMTEAHRSSTP